MKNMFKLKVSEIIIRKIVIFFLFLVVVKARYFFKYFDVVEGVDGDFEVVVEWGLSGKVDMVC